MNPSAARNSPTTTAFVILIVILGAAMTYARARANISLMHVCQYLLIALGAGLLGNSFLHTPKLKGSDFILIFLLFYTLLQGVIAGIAAVIAAGAFCQQLTAWRCSEQIHLSKKLGKIVLASEATIGLMLIYLSTTSDAHRLYINNRRVDIDSLTLGFSNPNEAGMLLCSVIIILLIATKNFLSSPKWKLLIYTEVAYLYWLLIATECRTALLTCSLSILALLIKLEKKKLRKHTLIVLSIMMLHVPFCYLYMSMANTSSYNDIEFMGKGLISGRQTVFAEVLNDWKNPLFGNMELFKFGNAHNGGLSIMVSIGIVGYILYCTYVGIKMKEMYHEHFRGDGIYAVLGILSFYIIAYTEATPLCSGNIFYINFLITLCLAHNARSAYHKT